MVLALCCVLHGSVRAQSGGPVVAASVTVLENGSSQHLRTDASGGFLIRVDPGLVTVVATAQGFRSIEIGPIRVDQDERMDIALVPADAPTLRTIATVRVNGMQTGVHQFIPSTEISRMQLDQMGFDRVIEGLAEVPSVTFARPDGGASTAPLPVALRGPDPSETLVTLDGQVLNDGNTGDLDLSQLPVSVFSAIEVTEGLGPSDLAASNTFGGAVNLISLRPTLEPRSAFSLSTGSFGRSEGWINASGTAGRLGYAFAADDTQEHGNVDQEVTLCTGGFDSTLPPGSRCIGPSKTHVGSTIGERTALMNLVYNISQSTDVGLRILTLGDLRDMSGAESAPVDPNDGTPGAYFLGPGTANVAQDLRAYDLHGRTPVGAGTLLLDGSLDDDSIGFTGSGVSPYDVTHLDRRENLSLSWQRDGVDYTFAVGASLRRESLSGDFIATTLAQEVHSYFVRGAFSPSERVHLEGGVYLSSYSTFGTNLDGRFGVAYDLDATSALHASVGTGFRAPLLIERYVFPLSALPVDANGVYLGQGNPNENPERATEYEMGYSKRINDMQLDASLYDTNLRDPIENYYPLAQATGGGCIAATPPCTEYPINVGNAVYQGMEVRLSRRFGDVTAWASYGVNVAYPENLPSTVANPTSGGNLVNGEQFLNIPPQQASLGMSWVRGSWHASLDGVYRGRNNELNASAFAVFDIALGDRFGPLDVTLAGTNVTDAVAGKFTLLGQGVPYHGAGGTIPTDLRVIDPAGVRVILTVRR